MTVKFHLTEEEFFDYNYYTAWASPDKKGYRIRYYLRVFLLYTAVAVLFIVSNHSQQMAIDFVIFGAIALAYFLMVPWLIKRSIRKRVRDILREPDNSHILGANEVVLTDTGIVDSDDASESRYTWEAIVRKAETTYCYYLYTNSQHAIVIPKRTLHDAAEKKEMERLLNTHLPLSSEFGEDEEA